MKSAEGNLFEGVRFNKCKNILIHLIKIENKLIIDFFDNLYKCQFLLIDSFVLKVFII